MTAKQSTAVSYDTIASQIQLLAPDFEDLQLALAEALARRDDAWLRIGVQVVAGKVTNCQKEFRSTRDLRQQFGRGS